MVHTGPSALNARAARVTEARGQQSAWRPPSQMLLGPGLLLAPLICSRCVVTVPSALQGESLNCQGWATPLPSPDPSPSINPGAQFPDPKPGSATC